MACRRVLLLAAAAVAAAAGAVEASPASVEEAQRALRRAGQLRAMQRAGEALDLQREAVASLERDGSPHARHLALRGRMDVYRALLDEDRVEEAAEILRSGNWEAAGRGAAEAYTALGAAEAMLGRTDAAVDAYREAVNADPAHPDPAYFLARAMARAGNDKGAASVYRRAADVLATGRTPADSRMPSGDLRWAVVLNSLGAALDGLGRPDEARAAYEEGVQRGVWPNRWQRWLRSPRHAPGTQPWFDEGDAGYPSALVARLEAAHADVRAQVDALLTPGGAGEGLLRDDPEGLLGPDGRWTMLRLSQDSDLVPRACEAVPAACAVLQTEPLFMECMRAGECAAFVSRLAPGSHILPHVGPSTMRQRVHLGVRVPASGLATLRVAGAEPRPWREGRCLVFADDFEHEVRQDAAEERVILSVDLWHPNVPRQLRRQLVAENVDT